ncbi:triose-phosphate isomerase [Sphingomonas piscis]|uniref:Triosephosphate isomerase n=1 Tax=Sphingomonas piscis TaxID=2714943 RepID=A0A6G7YSR2_9SPHN|nr:triose-phosphate isomerase [Sphingomonas piscis]QIK79772.1 triose-phosphate isomerase [Sphingomonas piscis]
MIQNKYVVGNWKMNGVGAHLEEVRAIAGGAARYRGVDVALCLPATLIHRAADVVPGFPVGAQDVHFEPHGAHTGCLGAAMLVDAGAVLTIVGHSERRERERSAEVRAKAEAAQAAGLDVIVCVGESLEAHEAGATIETVCRLANKSLPEQVGPTRLTLSYEPVWAIGSGSTPSPKEIGWVAGALRDLVDKRFGGQGAGVRILYGGSVNGSNAAEIFAVPNVDGALVGGASLRAIDFLPIVAAAAEAVERQGAIA